MITEKVKVLSLWQPYSMLWLLGLKWYETRPKDTSHTGTYLIHATKKSVKVDWEDKLLNNYETRRRLLDIAGGYKHLEDFPTGCIIGAVDMVDCYKINERGSTLPYFTHPEKGKQYIGTTERMLGDWREGRWCWEVTNRRVLKEPIPYKGGQGYHQKYKGDFNELEFIPDINFA